LLEEVVADLSALPEDEQERVPRALLVFVHELHEDCRREM